MEMPITVIITLFIAVVVAGIIVSFAQNTIFQGKQNVNDFENMNNKKQFGDKLIELARTDGNVVKDLSVQCAKDSRSTESTLCFAVKSNLFDTVSINALNNQQIQQPGRNLTMKVNIAPSFNVLFINYNPLGFVDIKT